MDSKWLSQNIVIFFLLTILNTHHVQCQTNLFSIVQFGAISDATTNSKQAFLNAWKKACIINGGTISIPAGTFQLSDIEFLGPCKGQTNFVLNGTLIAPTVPTPNLDYWIIFRDVDGLSISGKGTLNGNGASYWKSKQQTFVTSLKLEHVKNAGIRDIHSVNSKKFHFAINNCQGVAITNVGITAPGNSPNTDGIHLQASENIIISNTNIATGDDCISIGDGVTNMNITGINCGPGHGISIGSLGRYPNEKEVKSISVTNCNFTNTQNGLRIKTYGPSPPGLVSEITFQGIGIRNVQNPIVIDQHYCPNAKCSTPGESSIAIKGVRFIDVRGTSNAAVGVKIECSKSKPCEDIELKGVSLTFKGKPTTAICSSADVKFLGNNQIPSRCSK
ncbi:exopolygalacturonase-like [Salvia miltiorrhiza]|uniref:exopolygalacturonase-like n=1 Tax=Salvia miltiorrhiza TaxID=226208 RepID=UPI0025AC54DA|nr:exopolygalacturonase-like [Salvia miltiorrhiza]